MYVEVALSIEKLGKLSSCNNRWVTQDAEPRPSLNWPNLAVLCVLVTRRAMFSQRCLADNPTFDLFAIKQSL